MQNRIDLINNILRQASKFLYRDYFELENLQNSVKSRKLFVDRAKQQIQFNLQKLLNKYYNNIVFNPSPLLGDDLSSLDFEESIVLVETLDGSYNFERSIPFFALVVIILKKKGKRVFINKVAMNLPLLGEIFYTEEGKGSWLEKHSFNFGGKTARLRVSTNNILEDTLITCGYEQVQLKEAQRISKNIRIFDSYAYQIALLVSGKSDVAVLPKKIITQGLDLLVREAGGTTYIKDNLLIASNYQLQEQIKREKT